MELTVVKSAPLCSSASTVFSNVGVSFEAMIASISFWCSAMVSWKAGM